MRRAWLASLSAWDDFRAEPDEFIDSGPHVVVLNHVHARGKGSGAEVSADTATVFTLDDGKIVRQVLDWDTAKALKPPGCGSRRVAGGCRQDSARLRGVERVRSGGGRRTVLGRRCRVSRGTWLARRWRLPRSCRRARPDERLVELVGPIEVRVDDLIDLGDGRLVACVRIVGQDAASATPYTQSFAVVHRLRDWWSKPTTTSTAPPRSKRWGCGSRRQGFSAVARCLQTGLGSAWAIGVWSRRGGLDDASSEVLGGHWGAGCGGERGWGWFCFRGQGRQQRHREGLPARGVEGVRHVANQGDCINDGAKGRAPPEPPRTPRATLSAARSNWTWRLQCGSATTTRVQASPRTRQRCRRRVIPTGGYSPRSNSRPLNSRRRACVARSGGRAAALGPHPPSRH